MKINEAVLDLQQLSMELPRRDGSVETSVLNGVATATLNNIEAANSLTVEMMSQFGRFVLELAQDQTIRAFVLRSTGSTFCAGGHLGQVKEGLYESSRGCRMSKAMHTVLNSVRQAPFVSVSLVNGPAVGGGAELASATDFRIFSSTGSVRFAQASIGVGLGWGGANRLVDIVGRQAALRMVLSGEVINAEAALGLGLADVLSDDLDAASAALIGELSSGPVAAARVLKKQIVEGAAGDDVTRMSQWFSSVWGGADHKHIMGIKSK